MSEAEREGCIYLRHLLASLLLFFYINSSITAMKPNGRLTAAFHMDMEQCRELQSPASVGLTGTKCLQSVDIKFPRSAL